MHFTTTIQLVAAGCLALAVILIIMGARERKKINVAEFLSLHRRKPEHDRVFVDYREFDQEQQLRNRSEHWV